MHETQGNFNPKLVNMGENEGKEASKIKKHLKKKKKGRERDGESVKQLTRAKKKMEENRDKGT